RERIPSSPMPRSSALAALSFLALAACAAAAARPRGMVPAGTPDDVNIALARSRESSAAVSWREWSHEVFDQARREHRYVLLDGAGEWCHWCHVMDETTYRDAAVVRLLSARYIAVRVDIDSRPDLAARYAEYGWPATIVLSPEGDEVAKFRGYIRPERMR